MSCWFISNVDRTDYRQPLQQQKYWMSLCNNNPVRIIMQLVENKLLLYEMKTKSLCWSFIGDENIVKFQSVRVSAKDFKLTVVRSCCWILMTVSWLSDLSGEQIRWPGGRLLTCEKQTTLTALLSSFSLSHIFIAHHFQSWNAFHYFHLSFSSSSGVHLLFIISSFSLKDHLGGAKLLR